MLCACNSLSNLPSARERRKATPRFYATVAHAGDGFPTGATVKRTDLTGLRFGRLVVVGFIGKNINRNATYQCRCDCGATRTLLATYLLTGHTKSCGCLKIDMLRAKMLVHGHSTKTRTSPEYYSWANMIQRCENPNNNRYKDYGGRGIKVCERWKSFKHFLQDMGPRPVRHTLDRKDNAVGYNPDNCKWSTTRDQNLNRRKVQDLQEEINKLKAQLKVQT